MEATLLAAMNTVLEANPEMSFWEVCAELINKGELNFEATEDPGVHAFLYDLFRQAKNKSNAGRANRDM